MRRLSVIFALLAFCTGLFAQEGLAALRGICLQGESVKVTGDLAVEGVIVSDYQTTNPENGRHCAYLQNPDGSFGVRLVFANPSENALNFGDKIRLNLKECTLERGVKPDAISISGVRARAIDLLGHEDVTPAEVDADLLRDENLYTYIRLKNVDIVFKNGSYTNVHEELVRSGDSAPCLFRTTSAHGIYMLTDMACPWRRTGAPLPVGTVEVTGILTHECLERYASDMGSYTLRAQGERPVVQTSKKQEWKTLTGWEIPSSTGDELTFEILGTVKGLYKTPRSGDRVVLDCGQSKGYLWTDTGASISVYSGYTRPDTENNGFSWGDAIMFSCPASAWYEWGEDGSLEDSRAFYLEFDASLLKAGCATLALEFSAGTQSKDKCLYYPKVWKVEFSADGASWQVLPDAVTGKETFALRSVPYKGCRSDKFAAFGPSQYIFNLPQKVSSARKALLRISPATATENIKADTKSLTYIRFESIKIEYR